MNNDPIRFDGRVVLITGAGRGLGRAHALLMGARGATVVVNDLGVAADGAALGETPAQAVVAEINAAGGCAIASGHDIASPEGAAAMIAETLERFGRIDAVVHNAGILRDKSLVKLSHADVEDVLSVHLKAAFWVLQPAVAAMREAGFGRIVLTTSSSGLFGTFGQTNYAAAKMGLIGLMRVLTLEGARSGILVNAVAPSARTRMTEELLGDLAEQLAPEHVSPLVAWLCSDRCKAGSRIFSAGGGRYASAFIGLTPGWTMPGAGVASIEDIDAHVDAIVDRTNFIVPDSGLDELELMRAALSGRTKGAN